RWTQGRVRREQVIVLQNDEIAATSRCRRVPATPYVVPWKHLSGCRVSDEKWFCSKCAHTFFFSSRRRHTRSKRDWSSDVCSSDLLQAPAVAPVIRSPPPGSPPGRPRPPTAPGTALPWPETPDRCSGRASGRRQRS